MPANMPPTEPTEKLTPKEQELLDRATEADTVQAEAEAANVPEGKFSVVDLNSLVDSLNSVLEHFGRPPYPQFTEDIDGPLPADFVKALVMVSDAANASGLERLSWDVFELETDGDLESVQARLDVLSENQPFITWLRTDTSAAPRPAPEGPPAEAAPTPEAAPPAPPAPDADALMMARV